MRATVVLLWISKGRHLRKRELCRVCVYFFHFNSSLSQNFSLLLSCKSTGFHSSRQQRISGAPESIHLFLLSVLLTLLKYSNVSVIIVDLGSEYS